MSGAVERTEVAELVAYREHMAERLAAAHERLRAGVPPSPERQSDVEAVLFEVRVRVDECRRLLESLRPSSVTDHGAELRRIFRRE